MTHGALITLTPTVLECDHLLVLTLLDYFTRHLRASNRRIAVGKLFPVNVHQHVLKSELLACVALEQIDVDRVAFSDSILSPSCFDDCVRHGPREKSGNIHGDGRLTSEIPRTLTKSGLRPWTRLPFQLLFSSRDYQRDFAFRG